MYWGEVYVVPISAKENEVTHNTNKRFGFLNHNSHGGMTISQCQQLKGNIKSVSPRYLYQPMHILQTVNIYHKSVFHVLYPSIHLFIYSSIHHPKHQSWNRWPFRSPCQNWWLPCALAIPLPPPPSINTRRTHTHTHTHTQSQRHLHHMAWTSTIYYPLQRTAIHLPGKDRSSVFNTQWKHACSPEMVVKCVSSKF